MKILESYSAIAKSLFMEAEIDDEEMIKYKDKEGESKEMKAGSAKTMAKDHPAKIEYDRMVDKGGEEEPKGKALGKGDFERDFDDGEPEDKPHGGDTGTDADFQGEPPEGAREPDDVDDDEPVEREPQDDTIQQQQDYEEWAGQDENEELRSKMDDDGASYWLSKPDNLQYLKDNPGFAAKQMSDWSPEVLDYFKDNIASEKEESITINGKQYRPIKETDQRTFKEIYDRTFRSLK